MRRRSAIAAGNNSRASSRKRFGFGVSGSRRLLFDVPNRGNRLALSAFNRVPRPIDPGAPTDAGDGFLMRRGYTVVWCGWQHDVPAVDGLMRIAVPEAQQAGRPVSDRLL